MIHVLRVHVSLDNSLESCSCLQRCTKTVSYAMGEWSLVIASTQPRHLLQSVTWFIVGKAISGARWQVTAQ